MLTGGHPGQLSITYTTHPPLVPFPTTPTPPPSQLLCTRQRPIEHLRTRVLPPHCFNRKSAPASHVMAWVLRAGLRPASSQRLPATHVPAGRGRLGRVTYPTHRPEAQRHGRHATDAPAQGPASRASRLLPWPAREPLLPHRRRDRRPGVVTSATWRAGPRTARNLRVS